MCCQKKNFFPDSFNGIPVYTCEKCGDSFPMYKEDFVAFNKEMEKIGSNVRIILD